MADRQLGGATLNYETLRDGSVSCGTLFSCSLYGVHISACHCLRCSLHNCTVGGAVVLELCEETLTPPRDGGPFAGNDMHIALLSGMVAASGFLPRLGHTPRLRVPAVPMRRAVRRVAAVSGEECPVCYDKQQRVTAWQCGHTLCEDCCSRVSRCPVCRCEVGVSA